MVLPGLRSDLDAAVRILPDVDIPGNSFQFAGVSSSRYITRSYCTVSDFVTLRSSRRVSSVSRSSSSRSGRCVSNVLLGGFATRAS